jgi:hypothetical protein
MVRIGVLAEVSLLAGGADSFERSASSGSSGGSLVGEDFLGKDFRGERGKRCDSSLEVVTTGGVGQSREASIYGMIYSLPITLHVSTLQIAGAEGDLAGVAGEGVGRTRCHASHVEMCREWWYTTMCGLCQKWRAILQGRRSSAR